MNRSMLTLAPVLAAAAGLASLESIALATITIPTVPIANVGNAPDTQVMIPDGTTGYGSVAYQYNIGTFEVTIGQYAAFLNAVATDDTHGLMSGFDGITRSGLPGSYTYEIISGRANYPVSSVTYWSATRFANWLHNGQPTGAQDNSTTENGAYTLTAGGIAANTVNRNGGWGWAVASEDEWYKAAYHQPASQGGDSDNYWLYPTSSNTAPTTAQANINWNGFDTTTPVGSYAPNFYGAYDMTGNVFELNEGLTRSGSSRNVRGGAFDYNDFESNIRWDFYPSTTDDSIGFRVVQIPVPSSMALLTFGGVVLTRGRQA